MSVERSEFDAGRSAPKGAVFLSYAREDAAAAKRIAEALRAFGVEVWFDQNELRGGDTWDTNIRNQIRSCALFLPLVSACTEERTEGYFRREWKLAVDRTHDMAGSRSFIVPVVIDQTSESGAAVPEEFMRYQWTRLADGAPTPEFVTQVKRLLDAPKKPALKTEHPKPPDFKPVAGVGDPGRRTAEPGSATPATNKTIPGWTWGVLAVAVVGIGVAVFVSRKPETPPAAPVIAPPPASGIPAPSLSPSLSPPKVADAKSIAVLPFENRSEDKANGYFTDGIHEDILTNLAHISELRVVSRTSVMEYRGTTKKIRQIGQELGVAWLLEGSVQRVGNKVRVTGQLINARTDEHVWAQSYDRDLTDIFAIQSALASEIANALKATLSPEEKILLTRRPTTDPAAYDLYLQARQIGRNGNDTREEFKAQEELLQRAITLDPGFAEAWATQCAVQAQVIFNNYDVSADRLARARAALETAQRLDADNPVVLAGSGQYYYYALRDYPPALEYFERMTRQWPKFAYGYFMTGLVQRRQGRWLESLANLRRASELDPASAESARNLMVTFRALRRYDEAIAQQALRVRLLPESLRESFELARLQYYATGSTREGEALVAGPIAERAGTVNAQGFRKLWAVTTGDLATAVRLERDFPNEWGELVGQGRFSKWQSAIVLAVAGDLPAARARLEPVPGELRSLLADQPGNSGLWANLARAEAVLGHKEEALAAARKALELLSESNDSLSGTNSRAALIFVHAWTGDKDAACAELRRLLAEPSVGNVHEFKNGLWLAPLKGYPAFEAIVYDPKNNQPLF